MCHEVNRETVIERISRRGDWSVSTVLNRKITCLPRQQVLVGLGDGGQEDRKFGG